MRSAILILFAVLTVAVSAIVGLRTILPGHAAALDAVPAVTDPAPALGKIPDFRLTDESGQAFGSRELAGKVWVADFIFTRCPGTCPVQTTRMSQLQQRLAAQPDWDVIRLVSFSVDPENDTPAVLRDYARQAGAKSGHWRFLTGPRDDIWRLSKAGFKLGVGAAPSNVVSPLFHSSSFVLVDQQARIRGYYDGVSEDGVEQVCKAIHGLLTAVPP